jgi:hypothetical protein
MTDSPRATHLRLAPAPQCAAAPARRRGGAGRGLGRGVCHLGGPRRPLRAHAPAAPGRAPLPPTRARGAACGWAALSSARMLTCPHARMLTGPHARRPQRQCWAEQPRRVTPHSEKEVPVNVSILLCKIFQHRAKRAELRGGEPRIPSAGGGSSGAEVKRG